MLLKQITPSRRAFGEPVVRRLLAIENCHRAFSQVSSSR